MKHYYTNERNHQILISLLKAHNIKRVVASPGTANSVFIGSIQNDPFFEIYSSVDERSAAYIACGLAYASGEPVIISCTGATASRNYMPGLTEAYYSKLPILCITSSQPPYRVGHLFSQVTDRSVQPNDIVRLSVTLPTVNVPAEEWECEIQANRAITELSRHGGGPVHINLITSYGYNEITALTCRNLPVARQIKRVTPYDKFPELDAEKIGIFVGSHKPWSAELEQAVDLFCARHNAVVLCDHTSNYNGKYKILIALPINQFPLIRDKKPAFDLDLLIHIGEITGEEGSPSMIRSKQTWRVSEDGEIRDYFRNLTFVFEMRESDFFNQYAHENCADNTLYQDCYNSSVQLYKKYNEQCSPDGIVPLSNVWIAANIAPRIQQNSSVVLAILNTLRTWNYAQFRAGVRVFCPVGGFGIDGATSCALGIAISDPQSITYAVVGDLAFFYDLNSLGNRHISNNIRILLINNGCGVEFKKTYATAYKLLGEEVDPYVAAKGHFGNKSPQLVKTFAENLGFSYMAAHSKDEVLSVLPQFTSSQPTPKPLLLEVFINDEDERTALDLIHQRIHTL